MNPKADTPEWEGNIDVLRTFLFELADQVSTITTKLHHKEIDFDLANTMSVQYQEQTTQLIKHLLSEERQRLLTELESKLPDEKVGTDKIPLNGTELGYNIALQDVKQIFTDYRKGL